MGNIETSQIFNCVSAFASAGTYTVDSLSFGSVSADTGTTSITVTAGETVRAYGPIVRRASDDPSWSNVIPTSTATTSASAGSSAEAGTAAATAGSAAGDGSGSSDGGLSTGAKAGIGVGVAVGVLLVAAACVGGFMVGKRANRKAAGAGQFHDKQRGEMAAGVPVQELSAANTRHELHPATISELDGMQRK
ncbi:hypothetical protein SLS58_004721 [Diplodia intermedia]|uniref:Uncharacterized protein n=1 Tax=Diplodia intermedia TaxID=856260 RepID=A0ABR3TSS5_9PEZI